MMLIWVVATQIFCIFIPKIGEDEPILTHIFSNGLVQPPTSNCSCLQAFLFGGFAVGVVVFF